MGARIEIVFDGERLIRTAPVSLAGLLRSLDLSPEILSVVRNGQVVRRSAYEETWLEDGDRLEAVVQVGGG